MTGKWPVIGMGWTYSVIGAGKMIGTLFWPHDERTAGALPELPLPYDKWGHRGTFEAGTHRIAVRGEVDISFTPEMLYE
jgi:hypothetical protein